MIPHFGQYNWLSLFIAIIAIIILVLIAALIRMIHLARMQAGVLKQTNENLKNDPKQSPYEHSLSKLFKAKTGHSVIVANLYISDAEKMKTLPIEAQVDRDILMLEHRLNVLFDTRVMNESIARPKIYTFSSANNPSKTCVIKMPSARPGAIFRYILKISRVVCKNCLKLFILK